MKEHNPDPYKVLHLGPAATPREVARAYRSLVRAHHPDTRAPETLAAGPESGAQELQDIMDAYAVLGDPIRRAAYDSRHLRGSTRPEPSPGPRPPRAAPHRLSGTALIIGPVQWENPAEPSPGQQSTVRQVSGEEDLFDAPNREAPNHDAPSAEPAPDWYRILWWIQR